MSKYWLVQKDGNPDRSYYTNDVKELNTILGAELSERSYMSMEPGCVYWIMEHRIVCYDSAIEMKNNTGLENMWRQKGDMVFMTTNRTKVMASNWWKKWYAGLSKDDSKEFSNDLKEYSLNRNEVIKAMIEIHDRIFYEQRTLKMRPLLF